MKTKKFVHRFYKDISNARKQGIRQFFLYGDNVSKDEWFYNMFFGLNNLRQSLVFQLLFPEIKDDCLDYVLVWNPNEILLYEKEGDPHHPLKEKKLEIPEIRQIFLGKAKDEENVLSAYSTNRNTNQTHMGQEEKSRIESSSHFNGLVCIISLLKELTTTLIALIIEDLKLAARLWHGKEHKLEYIEKINELRKIPRIRHLSFILIDGSFDDEVKEYFGGVDSPDKIFIGDASIQEIYMALTHGETFKTLSTKTFEKLATEMRNSRHNPKNSKTLKGMLHLFMDIKKSLGSDFYNEDILLKTFSKRLDSPIEDVPWDKVYLNRDTKQRIDETVREILKEE